MQYGNLGRSGLKVSRLCLGCMTYGAPGVGHHEWTLPEGEARPLIRAALEAGIDFFDTANAYANGTSEEILGRALKDFARREDVVIATKVYAPMRPTPNGRGLSRKAIMNEIDASLRRLGTDYVDLYQIHRFDPETPMEETLQALDDVVRHSQKINFSFDGERDSIGGWTMMKPGSARSTKPFVRSWTSACAGCGPRPRLMHWGTAG